MEGIYNSPEEVMQDLFGGNAKIVKRFELVEKTIQKKYIGLQKGEMFYIQYGVDESSSDNPEIFEKNISLLENKFLNCTKTAEEIQCRQNSFYVIVRIDGKVTIQENNYGCDEKFCAKNFSV